MTDNTKKLLRIEELRLVVYQDFYDKEDNFVIKVGKFWRGASCTECKQWSGKRYERGKYRKVSHHPDVLGRKVYLLIRKDRYFCQGCNKTFTEQYWFLPARMRMTLLACDEVLKQLRKRSFNFVEEEYGISYRTAVQLLKKQDNLSYNWSRTEGKPLSIGLDKHSFSGREKVTTVTNLTDKEVVTVIPNERKQDIKKALGSFPEEIRKQIKEVCIDMDSKLKRAVEETLSAQVVVDHFHLIQDANRRIDEARRLEQEMKRVKITKRIWEMNEEKLDEEGLKRLEKLKKRHPIIAEFHWFKEGLRNIYRLEDKTRAREQLSSLIRIMEKSEQVEINLWARTLFRWKEEILAYFDNKTTNSYTEGVHTKMKLVKRVSYGFKNVEVYIKKVLLAFLPFSLLLSYPS